MNHKPSNPYLDGHAAGLLGRKTPHPPTHSRDYTRWLCGWQAARAELKRDAQRAATLKLEVARE